LKHLCNRFVFACCTESISQPVKSKLKFSAYLLALTLNDARYSKGFYKKIYFHDTRITDTENDKKICRIESHF